MSLQSVLEKHKKIMLSNERAIRESNAKMLPRLLNISSVLMCIPIVLSCFVKDIRSSLPGYGAVLIVCGILALIFRHRKLKDHALIGMYTLFTAIFGLVLYLSLVVFPERYAASALSFFCVMPLLFIDKWWRLNSVVILFYAIHTVLSFYVKGRAVGGVDALNCLVSAFLGISAGMAVLDSQLAAIEAHRLLTIEKETDVLTGLNNRRKLFETMTMMESGKKKLPSGVLMLDIDHFKEINDSYGHAVGDECLKHFGNLLMDFSKTNNITFYRYGGEEFVGLAYCDSERELLVLSETMRQKVEQVDMNGVKISVSIGEAWCGEEEYTNLEQWIERADKAVYEAKSKGRNSIFRYQRDNDTVIPFVT